MVRSFPLKLFLLFFGIFVFSVFSPASSQVRDLEPPPIANPLDGSPLTREQGMKSEKREASERDRFYGDPRLFSGKNGNIKTLTLEDVIRSVDKTYPVILAVEKLLTVAEYEYLAAMGAFDASFDSRSSLATGFYNYGTTDNVISKPTPLAGTSFFAGYRMGRGNFPSYEGKRVTNELGEIRAGAVVPLIRNREIDKNRADLKKADIDRVLADLNIQRLKIEVIREATRRYWKWVAAGQEYKVNKNLLKIAQERVQQVAERVRLGDLPAIENTENDRVILQREALLIAAKRELQKAAIDLSLFLRLPNGQMVLPANEALPENFPIHKQLVIEDEKKIIELAQKRRPEVKEFQSRRDKVAVDRQLEENNLKPQVDLVVAASQDMGAGSPTRSRTELDATVVMNIPIQTRRQRGRIGAAEARIAQIDQQEQFARDRIATEVQDAISEVIASYQRVEVAKREVVLAKKLEELEVARFNLGDSNLLFVNIREQTTAEAAIREVKALNDYFNAMANFQAATAEFLDPNFMK